MPLIALFMAASTPAVTIAPTGPWIVRGEENLCLLERSYPVDEQKVSLVFQPLLDLPTMDVFIIRPDTSGGQYEGKFTASINADGEVFTGKYYSVSVPKTKTRLTRLMIDRGVLDRLKDGDALHLQAKPIDLSFRIVRPEKARVALQNCVGDLKKSWGIDPEMASRVVTPLEGNPARYFGPSAYPVEALHAGVYGRVVAMLNSAADGSVEHCRIVSSAGTMLNEGTCKVAQRIRFKPPRDEDGKPLSSTYLLPVKWMLPGAPN